MNRYDYISVYVDDPNWESKLDTAGSLGYRVVATLPEADGTIILMERQKDE